MSEYRLTQDADDDLLKMFLYGFETFGLAQAEAYRQGMTRCFQLLADNPRLGRKADEFASGSRRHEHAHHVIFYDEQQDGVLIIGIIHERSLRGLRDAKTEFIRSRRTGEGRERAKARGVKWEGSGNSPPASSARRSGGATRSAWAIAIH